MGTRRHVAGRAREVEVVARPLAGDRTVLPVLELIATIVRSEPGRADVVEEGRAYERWLGEPDVGIAFDPEWAMGPRQVPMTVFGQTTGAEINSISAYLSGLVRARRLPEKVLVVHQLSPSILRDEKAVRAHEGVALVKSVDGIGPRALKESTYAKLAARMPPVFHAGFKLFYSEDRRFGPLMTPAQVLALRPQPEYVLYE